MKKFLCFLSVAILALSTALGFVGCEDNSINSSDEQEGTTKPQENVSESVTFSSVTIDLKENEQRVISVKVTPAGTKILWKSSKESVATVDNNGKVTAVSAGTALITASTISGKASAQCVVFVTESKETVSESVTLSPTSLELKENEQRAISAKVTPAGTNILWKSDKESVATVDNNGKVMAVSAGTAHIIASTVSGKASAECVVTVIKEEKPAPSVSVVLSKSELQMDVGDSYLLSAMVLPSESNLKVEWSSTNESCVTVEDGFLQAISPGTSFIQAKAGNASAVCAVEAKEVFGSISGTITCRVWGTYRDEVDVSTRIYLIADNAQQVYLNNIIMGFSYDNSREKGIYSTTVDALGKYSIENIKTGSYRMIISCGGSRFSMGAGNATTAKLKAILGSVYDRGDESGKKLLNNSSVGYDNQMSGFNVKVGKTPLTINRTVYGLSVGDDVY